MNTYATMLDMLSDLKQNRSSVFKTFAAADIQRIDVQMVVGKPKWTVGEVHYLPRGGVSVWGWVEMLGVSRRFVLWAGAPFTAMFYLHGVGYWYGNTDPPAVDPLTWVLEYGVGR